MSRLAALWAALTRPRTFRYEYARATTERLLEW